MYGEKIRDLRKSHKMSQEDLAEKLDVTRQAISKWEMDKADPTNRNLRELSEVFNVNMSYFYDEEINEAKNNEDIKEKFDIKKEGKNFFFWLVYAFIGFVFFAFYYFFIMPEIFRVNPIDMPYLLLTIYMIIALISFPQAYDYIGEKLENLDYNLFSKVVLPIVYVISPFIVVHKITKSFI